MNDYLNRLLKWIDYNRYKVGAIVLTIAIVAFLGCQPKSTGLDGAQVTQAEFQQQIIEKEKSLNDRVAEYNALGVVLENEVTATNQKITATNADFKAQIEFRQKILNFAGGLLTQVFTGQPIDIVGTITSAVLIGGTLLGLGATGDNIRKDKVIINKDQRIAALTGTAPSVA